MAEMPTIKRKICPGGLKNNPNMPLKSISYVTIHCTGNYSATATAKNHADYLYGGSGGRQTSWHYTVDKDEIWQSFEDTQRCWHATDGNNGPGNSTSIGIEICVNDKQGFIRACDNAAWMASELLKRHNLSVDKVVQHNMWHKKDCPSELRSGAWGVSWSNFVELVRQYLNRQDAEIPGGEKSVKFDLLGKLADIPGEIRDGVTRVQARALLEALDFHVGWNADSEIVVVRKKTQVSPEELNCLHRIVQAEAGGEDEKGKILVANVIFNRVADKSFPNDILGVVFQAGQFEPTRNGAYERTVVSEQTKIAVNKALCGYDYSRGATFFRTIKGASADSWHERALTRLFDWGGHRFYAEKI